MITRTSKEYYVLQAEAIKHYGVNNVMSKASVIAIYVEEKKPTTWVALAKELITICK